MVCQLRHIDQSPGRLVLVYCEGLPLVLIDPVSVHADLAWSGVDHRYGVYSAVGHLPNLERRRIAYIQGPTSHLWKLERYQGYRDAWLEQGIVTDPELFQQGDHLRKSGELCASELLL